MKKITQLAISTAITCASVLPLQAQADEPIKGFALILAGGITHGGDTLTTFEYRRYGDQDLDAGNSVYFGGGVAYTFSAPIQLQATINYQGAALYADNGDASFEKTPVELLAFYQIGGHHRIGLGATYHLNPEYEADLDRVVVGNTFYWRYKESADFEDALGYMVQYDYKIPRVNLRVGARYTAIDYEFSQSLDALGNKRSDVNGDNVGLTVQYDFNL